MTRRLRKTTAECAAAGAALLTVWRPLLVLLCVAGAGITAASALALNGGSSRDAGADNAALSVAARGAAAAATSSAAGARLTVTPETVTSARSAPFSWVTAPAGLRTECSLDGAPYAACSSPRTYNGLATGPHTFGVRVVSGTTVDRSPAVWQWTVIGAGPPLTVFTVVPPDASTSRTADVAWIASPAAARFQCSFDGGPYAACSPPRSYRGLALGDHRLCVRGFDNASAPGPPACIDWRVDPEGAPFTISGSAVRLLYPGGDAVPINLVFTNPNNRAIRVTSVTVSVVGTSTAACAAKGFSITRQLAGAVSVPASATRSLSDLGVGESRWPAIAMLNSGNQDGCKRATVNLRYAGTATR